MPLERGCVTQVLFVCDSGPDVGGGHVMRCLTLAAALRDQGIASTFVAPPAVRRLLDAFDRSGAAVLESPTPGSPQDLAAAADVGLDGGAYAGVIVDHYGMTAADEARLRGPGRTLVVLDDLADRPHDADLLVDPSFGRVPGDYAGLVTEEAQLLLGPAYALVRNEFAAARAQAPRRAGAPVRRVLVSLGLTDVGGITARVVDLLAPELGDATLDVITGAQAASLPRLRERAEADPRLTLHVEITEVAALMARADLAVGAGGSSTWERACLGLPTLTLVLTDNQVPGTARLADAGLTLAVDARAPGFEGAFADAFRRLRDDADLRTAMAEGTAALCDGRGAARVAARLHERLASPTGR